MPSYLLEVRFYWSRQMNKEFAARCFNNEQQYTPPSNKKTRIFTHAYHSETCLHSLNIFWTCWISNCLFRNSFSAHFFQRLPHFTSQLVRKQGRLTYTGNLFKLNYTFFLAIISVKPWYGVQIQWFNTLKPTTTATHNFSQRHNEYFLVD